MGPKTHHRAADHADRRLCSFTSNSMMLGVVAGGGSIYKIARSLRLNSSDSAALTRTPGSASNRRTFTWSGWIKRSGLGAAQSIFGAGNTATSSSTFFFFNASDQINLYLGGPEWRSAAVFRDPTAWFHLLLWVDTPAATNADRLGAAVNGVPITSWSVQEAISQNSDTYINNNQVQFIGYDSVAGLRAFNGYMAEIHFIDGVKKSSSDFGAVNPATGGWIPKRYLGSYGTNGYWLDFSDNSGATSSTLGKDRSGNNNDWTPTNISVTAGVGNDSLTDTPTPYDDGTVHGNFCTFNPLDRPGGTRTNGNLDLSGSGNGNHATFYANSGKWVYEITITAAIVGSVFIGWSKADQNGDPASSNPDGVFYSSGGNKYVNSTSGAAYGASYANGDVIRCEMDFDNNQVQFFKNGTGQGTISWTKTANSFYSPHCYANSASLSANFGQRAFSGTPTSGFKSLGVQNLPNPTILKPSSYNSVVLDTGTGAAKSVTGVGFQPDFVWRKSRSNATNHNIFDSVRGVQKGIVVNGTAVEYTDTATLTSFDSDGFSLGADGSSRGVNQSSHTYFTWAFKKSAIPAFDIVTWTGNATNRTISHALGVAPEFIIVRERDGADDWVVYHKLADASPQSGYLLLNTTGNFTSDTTVWNNTAPSGSVFSLGTSNKVNENTKNYVAYVFAPVRGYSLVSSYVGNGSSDGPMVPCGFRPQLLLIKRISSGQPFILFDAVRNPFNVVNNTIEADTTTIETQYGTILIDFLAGGFKLRGSDAWLNASSATYSFMAWANLPVRYAPAG